MKVWAFDSMNCDTHDNQWRYEAGRQFWHILACYDQCIHMQESQWHSSTPAKERICYTAQPRGALISHKDLKGAMPGAPGPLAGAIGLCFFCAGHGLPWLLQPQPWFRPRNCGERLQTANLQREVEGSNDLATFIKCFCKFHHHKGMMLGQDQI